MQDYTVSCSLICGWQILGYTSPILEVSYFGVRLYLGHSRPRNPLLTYKNMEAGN